MTTPVAAIPLTYDGDDIQLSTDDQLELLLQITMGLNEPGDVRGQDVTVPYRDGQVVRPRRFHELPIALTGHARGIGATQDLRRAAYRQLMRYLRALFDPARMPADLVAELEDGSTATIAARPKPGMVVNEIIQSEYAELSIPMVAVEDWTIVDAGS